ncbi:MAG: hypothetical protein V4805_01195 [Pseudomonadota bacterium]
MSYPDVDGWYSLTADTTVETIKPLLAIGSIEKLSISKIPLLTVKIAKRLANLRVEELRLWCGVTRRAMRYMIRQPGLKVLDVLSIQGPSQLANFSKAQDLKVFRSNCSMTEHDLLQVTQCAGLQELGAQSAQLSASAFSAILALPDLVSLDLEATPFDDKMAKKVSRSKTITSLDLGATRLTRAGLEHLVSMKQLRSLDVWATNLNETDLKLLSNLPELEYLSLGDHDGCSLLDPEAVTSILLNFPSLKRVWLDGIRLEASQRNALEAKLESLRLTCVDENN